MSPKQILILSLVGFVFIFSFNVASLNADNTLTDQDDIFDEDSEEVNK